MGEFSKYYDYDIAILKKYGNEYRLIQMNAVRKKGYEIPGLDDRKSASVRGTVNEEKLANNIRRAKTKIYEYAKCNPWSWFCTFTLNPEKYNRYDLKQYVKDFGEFLHRVNRRREAKVKYLMIPEMHKDGAWHMHALIQGLEVEDLKELTKGDFEGGKIPNYIRGKIENREAVFTWQRYAKQFGYCLFEAIRNPDACAKYIMKYVTKEMSRTVTDLDAHLYYASQKLEKAKVLKRGKLNIDITPDFANEYVKINTIDWLDPHQEQEFVDTCIIETDRILRRARDKMIALKMERLEMLSEYGLSEPRGETRKDLEALGWDTSYVYPAFEDASDYNIVVEEGDYDAILFGY